MRVVVLQKRWVKACISVAVGLLTHGVSWSMEPATDAGCVEPDGIPVLRVPANSNVPDPFSPVYYDIWVQQARWQKTVARNNDVWSRYLAGTQVTRPSYLGGNVVAPPPKYLPGATNPPGYPTPGGVQTPGTTVTPGSQAATGAPGAGGVGATSIQGGVPGQGGAWAHSSGSASGQPTASNPGLNSPDFPPLPEDTDPYAALRASQSSSAPHGGVAPSVPGNVRYHAPRYGNPAAVGSGPDADSMFSASNRGSSLVPVPNAPASMGTARTPYASTGATPSVPGQPSNLAMMDRDRVAPGYAGSNEATPGAPAPVTMSGNGTPFANPAVTGKNVSYSGGFAGSPGSGVGSTMPGVPAVPGVPSNPGAQPVYSGSPAQGTTGTGVMGSGNARAAVAPFGPGSAGLTATNVSGGAHFGNAGVHGMNAPGGAHPGNAGVHGTNVSGGAHPGNAGVHGTNVAGGANPGNVLGAAGPFSATPSYAGGGVPNAAAPVPPPSPIPSNPGAGNFVPPAPASALGISGVAPAAGMPGYTAPGTGGVPTINGRPMMPGVPPASAMTNPGSMGGVGGAGASGMGNSASPAPGFLPPPRPFATQPPAPVVSMQPNQPMVPPLPARTPWEIAAAEAARQAASDQVAATQKWHGQARQSEQLEAAFHELEKCRSDHAELLQEASVAQTAAQLVVAQLAVDEMLLKDVDARIDDVVADAAAARDEAKEVIAELEEAEELVEEVEALASAAQVVGEKVRQAAATRAADAQWAKDCKEVTHNVRILRQNLEAARRMLAVRKAKALEVSIKVANSQMELAEAEEHKEILPERVEKLRELVKTRVHEAEDAIDLVEKVGKTMTELQSRFDVLALQHHGVTR